jgi:protein-L-isoaspartate(D-aspartate) O-methyltransferase
MESFADLFLWCAGFLPGYCKVTTDDGAPADHGLGRYACACARRNSVAWLVTRKLSDGGPAEFGVRAVGCYADTLAGELLAQVRDWDRHGRDLPGNTITYWPAGTYRPSPAGGSGKVAVFRKASGTTTVAWPPAEDKDDIDEDK